jgi:hypothetical protein
MEYPIFGITGQRYLPMIGGRISAITDNNPVFSVEDVAFCCYLQRCNQAEELNKES